MKFLLSLVSLMQLIIFVESNFPSSTAQPSIPQSSSSCNESLGLDLIFIIDSSTSVYSVAAGTGPYDNWQFELDTLQFIVNSSLPQNKTRVGLINFSGCEPNRNFEQCRDENRLKKEFNLDDYGTPYNNLDQVYDRIDIMNGSDFNFGYTWTDEALHIALTEFKYNSSNLNHGKLIILITDGLPSPGHEPCIASTGYISPTLQALRNLSVRIIAAGVDVPQTGVDGFFDCIIEKPEDFYYVSDFSDLMTNFTQYVAGNICPDPTQSPTTDPTIDPTVDPTIDPTNDPTTDPTKDPTIDPTVDPTRDPTTDPTSDPTTDPTSDPTIDPTADPTTDPTKDPTADPTTDPTMDPTVDPTTDPTADPTRDPTADPTMEPTVDPTSDPTIDPTTDPTIDPTVDPTNDPTTDPTKDPTIEPTADPTSDPIADPTADPTKDPTSDPTTDPTIDPTANPTIEPTVDPSIDPTADPTVEPTYDPTSDPTKDPTSDPTVDPTTDPTLEPTADPITDPTTDPTVDPTADPTTDPTADPTADPTSDPTVDPTADPTVDPTSDPTNDPTIDPTVDPTTDPTSDPTADPTIYPTNEPTIEPTTVPTADPTTEPTLDPTANPTTCPVDCTLEDFLDQFCELKTAGSIGDGNSAATYNGEISATEDRFVSHLGGVEETINVNMIMILINIFFTLINVIIGATLLWHYHKLYVIKSNSNNNNDTPISRESVMDESDDEQEKVTLELTSIS